ncbi:MAG: putative amino acid transporter [Frankiales bacterium]|nr:putative amino acid transporter [Frankiales bacterium]
MDVTRRRRTRGLALPAALLAVALMAAGCGSSGDDDKKASGGTTATADALGTPNKATGQPITIGYVSTGKTPNLDSSVEIAAAVATAKYVNDYLGGINGRPIDLKVCETTTDPGKATDCANQMVTAKVPAVLGAVPNGVDQLVKVLTEAKIPLVMHQVAAASFLAMPDGFSMANPVAPFGGPAIYARDQKHKRVAFVVLDVPAAVQPAQTIGKLVFGNAGVAVDIVPIAQGTPDMTPQIQAAMAKNPEMFHILGDPNFCTSALKAIKTLGLKQEITIIPSCVSGTNYQSISGGFTGMHTFTGAVLEGPENDQFKAILAKYGVQGEPTARTAGGYQAVLGFVRAMQASKATDLSPTGVVTALRSMPPTPYPLGGGATFQCNGTAVALSKAICSTFGVVAATNEKGELSDYKTQDATGIYVLPK